jgi:hypothetical protein
MPVLDVGSEHDNFELVSGHAYATNSTSGRFDSSLARFAMNVRTAVSELYKEFAAVNTAWLHMVIYQESLTTGQYISLRDAGGINIAYRLTLNASGTILVERYSGGGFITVGTSTSAITANTLQVIDIKFVRSAGAGEFVIYRNATAVFTFSGNTNTDFPVERIQFHGLPAPTRDMMLSQFILADESTLNWKLATRWANADGFTNQWTGTYTDYAESVIDEATAVSTNAVGVTETGSIGTGFGGSFGDHSVKAVAIAARISNEVSSLPADAKLIIGKTTDLFTSPALAVPHTGAVVSRQYIWQTNPYNDSKWSQGDLTGLEAGIRST